MTSRLFTIIDRGVSHISSLNTLVDNALNWLAPKMQASAATCSGLRWAVNCRNGAPLNAEYPGCGFGACGFLISYPMCDLYYYNNGKKKVNCRRISYCACDPQPPFGSWEVCKSTCT